MTQETQTIAREDEGQALVIRPFPINLHRQVKSQAAAEGKKMREFVIEKLNVAVGNDSQKDSAE
jgi:predicted HicB family RNase H-like nuclease